MNNIFMNILLFRAKIDLCNHANDSTLYKAGKPLYKKKAKPVRMKLNLHKTHCATYKTAFVVIF